MKSIHVTPGAQIAGLLAAIAAITAVIASQLPEIRRYMKVRSMG
jgi:hypothetical protein